MKGIALFLVLLVACVAGISAQSAVQKIVDTENAFAARAAVIGTGPSFIEYMTDDARSFVPEIVKAKPFWSTKKANGTLLSWAPNFADAASDGSFGYTSGNWEFRAKGKTDVPSAFGDFNTVWIRQPDGKYKWLIDIGVSHDKPVAYSTDWQTNPIKPGKNSNGDLRLTMKAFDLIAKMQGGNAALADYASNSIRVFREDKMPYIGKGAASKVFAESSTLEFGAPIESRESADLAFLLRPYSVVDAVPGAGLSTSKGVVEQGNELQVWKNEAGKWRLVIDVLKQVPAK